MNKKSRVQSKLHEQKISRNYEDKITFENYLQESPPQDIIVSEELNIRQRERIRDLTSENDALRRALEKAEEKLNETVTEPEKSLGIPQLAEKYDEKDGEIKVLQEKLAQSNARLYECKNTCLTLRQEINKAQKLLCSETGDNVTISGLLSQPGGWRGRSEQIQQLQAKLTELQSRLNKQSSRAFRSSSISLDQRSNSVARSFDHERKQQIENLGKELRQAEVALENNRKKLEASRARVRVLENDLSTTKKNLILMDEKKLHDEQLIDALNDQLRAVESKYHVKEMDINKQGSKIQRDYMELKNQFGSAKLQVEQLRKKLRERQIEIDKLRSNILIEPESIQSIYQSTSTINQKSCLDPNEYVVLSLAAEAERERLLELVAVLNQRLDKLAMESDHVSGLFRNERNKNTMLEGKLQRFEAEKISMSKIGNGYRARFVKSLSSVPSTNEQLNSNSTHYKLELLEEECHALKARLATVQQEKATDLSTYKQMHEQVKKIFQDACRGQEPLEDTQQQLLSKNKNT